MGYRACYEASNSKIGDNSCVGDKSCYGLKDSSIKKQSCRSDRACKEMERTSVGTNSCGIGSDNTEACYRLWDSTIGDNSCQKKISCSADPPEDCSSCVNPGRIHRRLNVDYENYGKNLTIGNNACNLEGICTYCENDSVVPNDACNGDKLDITNSTCNHCRVSIGHSYLSLSIKASSLFLRTF